MHLLTRRLSTGTARGTTQLPQAVGLVQNLGGLQLQRPRDRQVSQSML
jgi:hypothetical protein